MGKEVRRASGAAFRSGLSANLTIAALGFFRYQAHLMNLSKYITRLETG